MSATLSTESNYGDYQLSFTGLPSAINNDTTVYGVVLHTDKGEDYGLRHLENIWLRTNLAWSAGVVTTTHGNTLAPEHYKSMMGKTITGLTYYTSNGIPEITLDDELYVPFKFAHAEFGVAGATVDAGKTAITGLDAIPEDYEAEYTITDPNGNIADGFTVENGELVWSGNAVAGTYKLTAKDKSGKYADLTASFVLTESEVPKPEGTVVEGSATVETFGYEAKVKVTYDSESGKIIKVEDNGTDPGNSMNESFWKNAIDGILSRFIRRTRDEVGSVDKVSGATLSSNAIKKAVQNALPEPEKPEDTNMSVMKFVVDGVEHTYYYATYVPLETPTLIVNGEDVTKKAKTIRANYSGKAYYYVEDDQKLTGTIYGLADVPYAELCRRENRLYRTVDFLRGYQHRRAYVQHGDA
ncbi:MAG: FMN-binding protein [Lachnospiraceae bacterium]